MAGSVVRFCAEDGADLEDSLEDADEGLFVELRALSQEGAFTEVVDGEDVRAALRGGRDDFRGLDLHEVQRLHRDIELLSEAFGTGMRIWFAHAPTIPENAKPAARAIGEARYSRFVEHVAEQFSGGKRFLDDLPREPLANDAELAAAAATDAGAGA